MICVLETDAEDWRQPIIEYLEHGKLPSDPRHKTEIQRRASSFLYYNGTLYRRSFLGLWLRCLDVEEEKQAMKEAQVCAEHTNQGLGYMIALKGWAITGPLWCKIA